MIAPLSKGFHWKLAIAIAALLVGHSIIHWWLPADYDVAIANHLQEHADDIAVECDVDILTYLSFLAGAYLLFWLVEVAPRLVGLLYLLYFGIPALACIAMSGVSLYFVVSRDGPVSIFVMTSVLAVIFICATMHMWKQL
jgi:hypothetical protein